MSAVADVLNRAADLIERDGWCQRRYRGQDGEHCVSDALIRAAGMGEPGDTGQQARVMTLYCEASDALRAKVRRKNLPRWNDAPGRTQAEVVAALRAAAERAS